MSNGAMTICTYSRLPPLSQHETPEVTITLVIVELFNGDCLLNVLLSCTFRLLLVEEVKLFVQKTSYQFRRR